MKIHFPLTEMTFLRYFVPVALEAKKRGHDPVFSLAYNRKYNNPCSVSHRKVCDDLIHTHGFKYGQSGDITVCVEGIGANQSPISYALTYMYDFPRLYSTYINEVNHVVFPSEYFAEFFNCTSDKNLYLGSPKYDVSIDPTEVYRKYHLNPEQKYALIVYPKARDMSKLDIGELCSSLISQGYTPLLKTRGKDPIRQEHKKYLNFSDESWYPHASMEFITIADKIINTGSSIMKEVVMLGKESVVENYNIKPSSCPDIPALYEDNPRQFLGPEGSASARIIDHMENTYG